MMLELPLRQFSLSALFAQIGGEEPPPSGMTRRIHWVGQKPPSEQDQKPGGKRRGGRPKKKDARGYRDLSTVTLGEVDEAHKFYAPQLAPSPAPAWIAPHYFCLVHLKPAREARPPAVFGRVKTCYPGDGYLQNIQELELLLPGRKRAPDVIHLRANDILNTPERPLHSYCVRVKFLASPEDQADFSGREGSFVQQGLLPEFHSGYIDLLEINEHERASLPWLYVIGSRWFASIPVSMQPEIREKLTRLIQWQKAVFNYHPERLPREIRPLNRELGYKAGFTDTFLIEPETPEQTVDIAARTFGQIFKQPLPG